MRFADFVLTAQFSPLFMHILIVFGLITHRISSKKAAPASTAASFPLSVFRNFISFSNYKHSVRIIVSFILFIEDMDYKPYNSRDNDDTADY